MAPLLEQCLLSLPPVLIGGEGRPKATTTVV